MKKENLGIDSNGVTLTMRQSDLWAYGLGVLGVAVISQLIGQISYFYTDKAGLAAELVGTALMATKIADAVSDVIMGQITDRTKSKYGKARPWMLWMIVPVVLSVLMLLCVPQSFSQTQKFIYVIVSNILASAVVCTAVNVPYTCLMIYRSNSQVERTKMNVRRAIVNYLSGMVFNVAFIPITGLLGGDQASWIKVAAVLAAAAALGMFICFRKSEEIGYTGAQAMVQETESVPFRDGLKAILTNRYWVIMLFVQLAINVVFSLTGATNSYYAKWIFGNEGLVGVMGAIAFIPALMGFVCITPLVKKYGPEKVVKIALLLGVIGSIGRTVFAESFIGTCIFAILVSISTIPFMMVGGVLVANVTDFEEWRSGKRIVGLVNSASSFGQKVGSGVGAGMIGWVLGLGGYKQTATMQPASAITSIYAVSIWIPGIMLLFTFMLMCAFNLEKKYPDFRKELLERRAQKERG